MGYEWIKRILSMLEAAGLPTREAYPAGKWLEIQSPTAAVALEGVNAPEGKVTFRIQVLSPRTLGGWRCQIAAADVCIALEQLDVRCQSSPMEYQEGNDCFCVAVTAVAQLSCSQGRWTIGPRTRYVCGKSGLYGVEEFTAERDLDRRLIGAFCQGEPVGVTPGSGGWKLKLVQRIGWDMPEPEEITEPFTLTAYYGDKTEVFTGCYWNETVIRRSQEGVWMERRGFALQREVH